MIISIFTQTDDAEGALNNLAETDFEPKNISVLMKTKEEAQAISDTSGVLTGTSIDELAEKLIKLGLPEKNAKKYEDAVRKGAVLIAVSTGSKDEEAAVRETLKDANGKLIKRL